MTGADRKWLRSWWWLMSPRLDFLIDSMLLATSVWFATTADQPWVRTVSTTMVVGVAVLVVLQIIRLRRRVRDEREAALTTDPAHARAVDE